MKFSNVISKDLKYFSLNILVLYTFFAICGGVLFPLLYKYTSLSLFLYAGAVKDFLLFLLISFLLLVLMVYLANNSMAFNKNEFFFIRSFFFFTLFFCIAALKGQKTIGTIVLMMRRYYLPLMIIIFFIFVDVNEKLLNTFIYFFVLFVCFFGLIEYFSPYSFWDSYIELPKYWADSGDKWARDTIAKSGRFTSYDLTFLLGHSIRRMCSSFAEPTNFSSFLLSAFIILRKKPMIRILCLICCGLAISKAALVVIFALIPILYIFKKLINKRYDVLYIVMFVFLFVVAFFVTHLGYSIGPFSHMYGYYSGVDYVLKGNIFGMGLGTVGNYSEGESLVAGLGVESGFGGMFAQCGFAAFFYILFFIKMIRILQQDKRNFKYIELIFAWTVICIFSESAFGASGNYLFYVYPSLAINRLKNTNNI